VFIFSVQVAQVFFHFSAHLVETFGVTEKIFCAQEKTFLRAFGPYKLEILSQLSLG
jgi:hypothetical protein